LIRFESDDFVIDRTYGTPFDDIYLEAAADVIA